MWDKEFVDVALAVSPFAVGAATALLAKGAQYAIHAVQGIKNKNLRDGLDWAIGQADSLAQKAVVAANESLVNGLKASGSFDATAASKVFHGVVDSVTANLSANARAILNQELPDVPALLGTLVESHVATAPNKTHAAAKVTTPAAPAAS